MTPFQRTVKYISIGLAAALAVSIIIGGVSILGAIFGFGKYKVLDEPYDIEISQDIEKIEIDISAVSLKIVSGEKFSLSTNIDKLEVDIKHSTLYIKQKQNGFFFNSNNVGELVLTIPASIKLKAFDLDAGAGQVEIEYLNAQNVEMDMGAGELLIKNGNIENIDLDLGVGETEISAHITGNSTVNCGVGDTNIHLLGQKSDYTLDINTGIGTVTLDGKKIDDKIVGDGANKIKIDGGVGSIDISFANE